MIIFYCRLCLTTACFLLPIFANSQGKLLLEKDVSVDVRNASIESFLKDVGTRHFINFSYSSDLIPEKKIDVSVHKQALYKVLDKAFEGTNIKYFEYKNQVVLKGSEIESEIDTISQPPSLDTSAANSLKVPFLYKNAGKKSIRYLVVSADYAKYYARIKKKELASAKDSAQSNTRASQEVIGLKSDYEREKWSITIAFAPENTFRKLSTSNVAYNDIVSYRNIVEKAGFGFSSGIAISYFPLPKFFISTGVGVSHFSYSGYLIDYRVVKYYPPPALVQRTSYSYTNNVGTINIPLLIGLKLGKEALNLRLVGGIEYSRIQNSQLQKNDVFFNQRSDTTFAGWPDQWPTEPKASASLSEEVNTQLIFLSFKTDLSCRFSKKVGLSISPQFRYALQSIYESDSLDERLYSVGCAIGFRYYLNH